MTAPVFAVVGHVNRGKSSVVSTLAADESVRIGDQPGTTTVCRSFPFRVDGHTLYTLVDTPGFERARHVLRWLRAHETSTADRPKTLAEFVRQHADSGAFPQECKLLRPIIDGASILYVVDGSIPWSPRYETEAEILQWSGRPRVALINNIGDTSYVDEWRPVLDQYFSIVRVFDAHEADFSQRIGLLRSLREVDEAGREAIDSAIEVLEEQRHGDLRLCAQAVTDALIDLMTHVEDLKLPYGEDPDPHREPLAKRFYSHLRERELLLRHTQREFYQHRNLEVEQEIARAPDEDLFDESTWSRLGLSRAQLSASGAATGFVGGSIIDASVGGASFLLGGLIGTVVGAATSWWSWNRLAEVEMLGQTFGGARLRIGPMRNRNFPWVALDRALIFHVAVATRAHANRQAIRLPEPPDGGLAAGLPSDLRKAVQKGLDELIAADSAKEIGEERDDLTDALEAVLEYLEEHPPRLAGEHLA